MELLALRRHKTRPHYSRTKNLAIAGIPHRPTRTERRFVFRTCAKFDDSTTKLENKTPNKNCPQVSLTGRLGPNDVPYLRHAQSVDFTFYDAVAVVPALLSPDSGGERGGTLVTLSGSGFVDYGGALCRRVVRVWVGMSAGGGVRWWRRKFWW